MQKDCSQQDGAEAPVKHQALQEQRLLEIRTFPAAPELEAPVALRISGHCVLSGYLHVTEGVLFSLLVQRIH